MLILRILDDVIERLRLKRFIEVGLFRMFDTILEKIGMGLFAIIGGVIAIIFLPVFILIGIIIGLVYLYAGLQWLWENIKDRLVVPFATAFAGVLMGACGGIEGSFFGACFGLLLGISFEVIRCRESRSYPSSGWGWMPYDDGASDNYVSNQTPRLNLFEKERPWIWKGYQTTLGPKEDELRKDLEK